MAHTLTMAGVVTYRPRRREYSRTTHHYEGFDSPLAEIVVGVKQHIEDVARVVFAAWRWWGGDAWNALALRDDAVHEVVEESVPASHRLVLE
jgi:hypothetical protein